MESTHMNAKPTQTVDRGLCIAKYWPRPKPQRPAVLAPQGGLELGAFRVQQQAALGRGARSSGWRLAPTTHPFYRRHWPCALRRKTNRSGGSNT